MKVLFCHDGPLQKDEYGNMYGIAHNDNMLKRYYKIADELHVLMRQSDIKLEDAEKNFSKITLKPIKFINVPNTLNFRGIKNIVRINKIIKQAIENVDCVIIRLPSLIGFLAESICIKLNKPYLIEVVGCPYDSLSNHGKLLNKIIAPFAYITQKYKIRRSKYTTYITKSFLQNRYPTRGKKEIIPNVLIQPVDDSVLTKRLERQGTNSKITIGLIGSLNVDYKGHETLLRALGRINEDIPNFEVQFVGAGDKKRWELLAEELGILQKVKFIGTIPSGEKIFEWIDSIDLAIQPSTAEGQGRSIIEEMSRGCPVLATSVGGIVELIEEKYLVEPLDYIALSSNIKNIIKYNEMNKISIVNFNKAKEYYLPTIESRMELFYNIFKNDLEGQ